MKTSSKRQLTLRKLEALARSTTHMPEAETARAKIEDLKVHTLHVQVAPVAIGRNDHGTVEIGHYFVEGGNTVVICDSEGEPRNHWDVATRVTLLRDQNPEMVARGLIRKMYSARNPSANFYRKLHYPPGAPV